MSSVSGLRKWWSDLGLGSSHELTNETCILRTVSYSYLDVTIKDKIQPKENENKRTTDILSPNLFNDLPEELIVEIFSFIPLKEICSTVPFVCKKWKNFAASPFLWQHLDFNEIRSLTDQALYNIICMNCPLLKRLSLRCRSELSACHMLNIAKSCPMLQQLSLAFCSQINKKIVTLFAEYCPDLQDINLEGCDITDDCLNDLSLLPLRKVSVSHCVHLSDDGLKTLTSKCSYLKSINFDGIQWITDNAIFVMVEHCYVHLEKLWLDGANLTDKGIQVIASCINLKLFSLSFCDNLSDETLRWIKQMKRLHTLRLKKGVNFTAKALHELFIGLHVSLMENGTGILNLYLPECSEMDDETIKALAESFPNLLEIDLSWCWDITDRGFRHVVLNCSQMQSMIICGMREIVGDCLFDLPKLMPHLKYLDASQCNKMSDELLMELVNKVHNLTIVNYYSEILHPMS